MTLRRFQRIPIRLYSFTTIVDLALPLPSEGPLARAYRQVIAFAFAAIFQKGSGNSNVTKGCSAFPTASERNEAMTLESEIIDPRALGSSFPSTDGRSVLFRQPIWRLIRIDPFPGTDRRGVLSWEQGGLLVSNQARAMANRLQERSSSGRRQRRPSMWLGERQKLLCAKGASRVCCYRDAA